MKLTILLSCFVICGIWNEEEEDTNESILKKVSLVLFSLVTMRFSLHCTTLLIYKLAYNFSLICSQFMNMRALPNTTIHDRQFSTNFDYNVTQIDLF